MSPPIIWAHRGASQLAPENTFAAFVAALEAGADGIELDIHLSHDGVPVVIHDQTLERTTDGHGPVSAMTATSLRRLDAGSWFSSSFAGESIPLLEDVLESFTGRLRLNLELKEYHTGMIVLDLLKRFPDADVVVSSFDYELLNSLRGQKARLPLAVLFDSGGWRQAVQTARNLNAVAFHPACYRVNRPMLAACRKVNLPVFVWTVDSPLIARGLLRAGVSGFFTNDPDRLLQKAWMASTVKG